MMSEVIWEVIWEVISGGHFGGHSGGHFGGHFGDDFGDDFEIRDFYKRQSPKKSDQQNHDPKIPIPNFPKVVR